LYTSDRGEERCTVCEITGPVNIIKTGSTAAFHQAFLNYVDRATCLLSELREKKNDYSDTRYFKIPDKRRQRFRAKATGASNERSVHGILKTATTTQPQRAPASHGVHPHTHRTAAA